MVLPGRLRAQGDAQRAVGAESKVYSLDREAVRLDHPCNGKATIGFEIIGEATAAQQAAHGAVRLAHDKTGAIRGNKTALLIIKETAAIDRQPGHAGPGDALVFRKIACPQFRRIDAELAR